MILAVQSEFLRYGLSSTMAYTIFLATIRKPFCLSSKKAHQPAKVNGLKAAAQDDRRCPGGFGRAPAPEAALPSKSGVSPVVSQFEIHGS